MGDIDDRNMPRSSIASHKKKKKGIPVYASGVARDDWSVFVSGLAQNGWGVFGAGVVSVVSVNGAAGMADSAGVVMVSGGAA